MGREDEKEIANLKTDTLYEMGDAMKVQMNLLNSSEKQLNSIKQGINYLEKLNEEIINERNETQTIVSEFLKLLDDSEIDIPDLVDEPILNTKQEFCAIEKTKTIPTEGNWEKYKESFRNYAKEKRIDLSKDAFTSLLSEKEYNELQKEINIEFSKKTAITNSVDLKFLAIAIALQVSKGLLFPLVSENIGYGQSFNPDERLKHNDKKIIQEERQERENYKNKKLNQGKEKGEWIEFLYRTPPYDTTVGSPAIEINMEGKNHRIHTLGHDPILGWIFGTANILTDVITFDTFASYKVIREPKLMITPEKVSFLTLLQMTVSKIKEDPLNLPAAIVAEKIHLKSDMFTKRGLPVPILETFAPEFAGKLYKSQYDALCFGRDLKVVGISATISVFIDMIISLTHALYYEKGKDGTKDMFEIRTRKILLISNAIASTSNIIYSVVTENPKALDIGGLFNTISHLFFDSKFILSIKKEFIENKIYEKIENEIYQIENSRGKLNQFEYRYLLGNKQ